MWYVRFPPSFHNVEDLLHDRGIEISHEAAQFWWNFVGPLNKHSAQHKNGTGPFSGNRSGFPKPFDIRVEATSEPGEFNF